jgi:isopenicillin-N epimerase
MREHWTLDPSITFLNHGSYGACPKVVQDRQSALRSALEAEPVRFMGLELQPLLDAARARLATLVGAATTELAFLRNATTGVNCALFSFPFRAGDEVLVTDHEYNACRNALDRRSSDLSVKVRPLRLPFPLRSRSEITAAVLAAVTPKTRLLLIDHVTSPTGLILPVEDIVPALKARGVECIVDGAHAPGMLPLDLTKLGAAYYTGNCHKWLCAPKGTAFLRVRPDLIESARPVVTSHGMNAPLAGKSRFQHEFDWTGTDDYTGWATLPTALDFLENLLPGGHKALMESNHAKALAARVILQESLGVHALAPDDMIGTMAAVQLPDHPMAATLGARLMKDHKIEVPITEFPGWPHHMVRVSAMPYNTLAEYERLARALKTIFA